MALGTYSELQTAVIEYAMRQADAEFSARVPDFITLLEKRVGDELLVGNQETAATVTLTNGAGPLPADYLAMRSVRAQVAPVSTLQQIELDQAFELYPTNYSGYPYHYTISGTTITTYPLSSGNLNIVYYAAIPALSDDDPTNWLLTRAPQIYLYGTLLEAMPYMEDDARAQTWGVMYEKAVNALKTADLVARSGRMQSRVRFPTP